jgi:PhoPQ-activated pathogenicity-related protein
MKYYSLLNGEKSYLEVPNTTHDLMGDEKELIGAV